MAGYIFCTVKCNYSAFSPNGTNGKNDTVVKVEKLKNNEKLLEEKILIVGQCFQRNSDR